MNHFLRIGVSVSFLCAAAVQAAGAEDLRQRWGQAVRVDWQGAKLRHALVGLMQNHGLGVVLDRRVDPEKVIEFSIRDVPLNMTCVEIAEDQDLGFVTLGPVAYFGPRGTSRVLRTLAALVLQQAEKLPSDRRAKFTALNPWRWEDLATPRELFERLAKENGAKVTGLELLPHDLWAANELPPISLADRLTLIAAQYDLAVRLEEGGKTIALVAQDPHVAIERSYPGGNDPEGLAKRWANKIPEATITVAGKTIVVRGLVEDHEQLTAASSTPAKSAPNTGGQQVHTLNVDDIPLGKLLESLARTMELKLQLDRDGIAAKGIALDKHVSLHVDKVSTIALFKKLLNPAGLDAQIEGGTLRVFAK